MPPKQNQTSTDRLYGLSDAEMKTAISVLRLLAIDGNIPVDKVALAKLTGHEKPNSAYKIWTLAKAKLAAGNGTADDAAPNASTAKPIKRARATTKTKSSGSKKVVAAVNDDEEEEQEDSGDELNEPAPKRTKKLGKQQSANDSC